MFIYNKVIFKFIIIYSIYIIYKYLLNILIYCNIFGINDDFILYISSNVYLFKLNGVPSCEFNLLIKDNNNLSKIKYVKHALFMM
jgi:hypothetical protein